MTLTEAESHIFYLNEIHPEKLIEIGIDEIEVSDEFLAELAEIVSQSILGAPNMSEDELFDRTLKRLIKEKLEDE